MKTFGQTPLHRTDVDVRGWSHIVAPRKPPKANPAPTPAPPGGGDDERAERFRPAPSVRRDGDLVRRGMELVRRMLELAEIERRGRGGEEV